MRGWIMYNLPTTAQLRITWYYVRVSSALPEVVLNASCAKSKVLSRTQMGGKVPCNCPSQLGSRRLRAVEFSCGRNSGRDMQQFPFMRKDRHLRSCDESRASTGTSSIPIPSLLLSAAS